MKARSVVVLLIVLFSAAALRAEVSCPWLTQGTAASMLGGDVDEVVKLNPPDQGSCAFSLQQGAASYSLMIIVEGTQHTACPPASPRLAGIGNEAVACRLQRAPNETAEVVSGRVRRLFFTISLIVQGPPSPSLSLSKQREIAERAAEQVAGNLD